MAIDLFLNHKRGEAFRISEKVKALSGKEYEISDRIDCGGNAAVHRCIETISGEEFAIKFHLSLAQKKKQRFLREIDLLRQIQHEQLIKYIDHGDVTGTTTDRKSGKIFSRDVGLAYLVMPLADSNLLTLIRKNRNLLYEDYIGQFKGLARALGVLHQKAVHRDIKPENILVMGETWMLSDFGLCKFHDSSEEITFDQEAVGPRYWMSPEAVNKAIGNQDDISKGSDVFQLCSVFWFIVTGRHPGGCVSRGDWNGPENIFKLLLDALSHDEKKRPSDGEQLAKALDAATLSLPS
ncbi:MAG: protein kinase [Nitrospirota bacterium]